MPWQIFVPAGIGVFLFVLVIALALADRRRFRVNWRTGIVLGILWFVLVLPTHIFIMAHLNAEAVLSQRHISPQDAPYVTTMLYLSVIIGFTVAVIGIPWYMLVYHAAAGQWEHRRPQPFPLLQRTGRPPWRAIGGTAAFGLAAGGVSAVVFKLLGVDVSEMLRHYGALLADTSPLLRLAVLLPAVCGAAIAEELAFRGVLFGWLLRLAKGRTAGVVLAMVAVSLVWAALHYQNTNAPLVKCSQIFVIGIFLCVFARRWCLEAAMAAHVGLNIAALLIGIAIR